MGFPPREVKQMSRWEYLACVEGWNRAQGAGAAKPMSDEEYDALSALADRWNDVAS